jgi:hypothetical protein
MTWKYCYQRYQLISKRAYYSLPGRETSRRNKTANPNYSWRPQNPKKKMLQPLHRTESKDQKHCVSRQTTQIHLRPPKQTGAHSNTTCHFDRHGAIFFKKIHWSTQYPAEQESIHADPSVPTPTCAPVPQTEPPRCTESGVTGGHAPSPAEPAQPRSRRPHSPLVRARLFKNPWKLAFASVQMEFS